MKSYRCPHEPSRETISLAAPQYLRQKASAELTSGSNGIVGSNQFERNASDRSLESSITASIPANMTVSDH